MYLIDRCHNCGEMYDEAVTVESPFGPCCSSQCADMLFDFFNEDEGAA